VSHRIAENPRQIFFDIPAHMVDQPIDICRQHDVPLNLHRGFVTLRQAGTTEAVLRAHCAQRLSDYKVPESITLSTTPLPRNANGKLLKRALRDQLTPTPTV
jgi:acyl-CoA synthetase (AMP-forming)/AMP-acid ligase II